MRSSRNVFAGKQTSSNLIFRTNHMTEYEYKWFAIKTKYKAEKFVSRVLNAKGIRCYVPLILKSSKYGRKIKTVEIPLLNCYAFVNITKGEYQTVLRTAYVIDFLKQGKDLISIPEREIEILRKVTGEHFDINSSTRNFSKGEKVTIVSGALTGLEGEIVEINGKNEFVVVLENIGMDLIIKINPRLLIVKQS